MVSCLTSARGSRKKTSSSHCASSSSPSSVMMKSSKTNETVCELAISRSFMAPVPRQSTVTRTQVKPLLKGRFGDEPSFAKTHAWYLSALTCLIGLVNTYAQSLGRFFHCDGVWLHWVFSCLVAITADHVNNSSPINILFNRGQNERAECQCPSATDGLS